MSGDDYPIPGLSALDILRFAGDRLRRAVAAGDEARAVQLARQLYRVNEVFLRETARAHVNDDYPAVPVRCEVCGEPAVTVECDQIEVTLGGFFPSTEADTERRFIRGPVEAFCAKHA
jgi:hypothetical protein